MEYKRNETCCFIGHRKLNITEALEKLLYETLTELIVNRGITTFLFGSRSEFDTLCLKIVSSLKEKFPFIKKIYVRAEYQYISEDYRNHLLKWYDDTYYSPKIQNSGKAVYVERNYEMINCSSICVCYYNREYQPPRRKNSNKDLYDYQPKSGTKIAYEYAIKKCDSVINMFCKI